MQILNLTTETEKRLLERRVKQDPETHAIAAKIIAEVRKRGDAGGPPENG